MSALPAALAVDRALRASGALAAFNAAGVLAPADVHVALRLGRLADTDDDLLLLAAALAVRAPRLGHVCVDLATIRDTAAVDADEAVDLAALPWPEPGPWVERVRGWRLVAGVDPAAPADRPLRLDGTTLYLDRYWREEIQVAADLRSFDEPADGVDAALLATGVERLFPDPRDGLQRAAASAAVRRRLAVVAGGPGTGKTTTVARIVALLAEQAVAAQAPPPVVALAAPTGKAAARLQEAVRGAAPGLAVSAAARALPASLEASTLHRLLGRKPASHSRFRHHRGNRLPHDVVIVDETSMVALSLMARLLEAIRPGARLILVGDPGQLTSIEAGAVLGDIVGPADRGRGVGAGIVVLERVHRYGGGIASVADAIRAGDADATLRALRAAPDEVTWIAVDPGEPGAEGALGAVRDGVVATAGAVAAAARDGRAAEALDALGAFRLLCAHRRGPHGVATWMERIEGWLADALPGFGAEGAWYPGRPLLVTENDYGLRLYNGDTGVVIATAPGVVGAAFRRGDEVVELRPSRLAAVETVYAMTVHKSQGSQFDTAAVLLPEPGSRLLTRELLYTAVTRAREHLVLAGTEAAIRAAVERPVARASGLRGRLWD